MNSFLPQERQIFEMKFPTFNNGLMNRFMRHGTATKISFVRPRFFEFCHRWQSFGKTYLRCVDDYRKQIQVNQQTCVVTTAMTAILKQFQATPPPAFVKSVEEIDVTCGDAHPYYQCLVAEGNTFLEFWDNIQGYVSATTVNNNQGNSGYRPPSVNMMASFFQMNIASTSGSRPLPSNTISNSKGKLKAITTQSGLDLGGPSVPMPPPFINPKKDEHVEETLTDPKLAETTNLRNEISNFQHRFDESFHDEWDRYKDLLCTCPRYGFTKFHQLDTFYNALNLADQVSLNSSTDGNLLERHTQDVLTIIENKSKLFPNEHRFYFGFRTTPSNIIANPKGELKAITTRSGLVLDGPFVPMPPPFINLEGDERAEETLTNPEHAGVPLHPHIPYPLRINQEKQQEKDEIQIHKFWQMFKQLHINITLADALILISKYQKMLKGLLSNKEKLLELENKPLNENFLAVILKKLPEKLGDPGKFLIPCGFSELKCKALANLANQVICTPTGIARDVFVLVGKFTFLADFVIVDYESDPRVPLILGGPFLRTARALIDVHEEEMILRDGDERLTMNMRHDTLSYSNQPHKESINMINIYNDSYEDYLEDLFATNHLSGNPTFSSHTDLTSPEVINPLSGNTTSSSPKHLLEEFTDELTFIIFPPGNDDLTFDIKSDLRVIEYLLNHDPTKEMDSILEDSVDECNLVDPNNDLVDTIPEMFTNEHTLDYSSSPLYDDIDDDLV
nr:hypothetical protein [Tanacetum cinerariifolium]